MVTAIEPAVRLYEEPPTEGDGRSRPPWADVWLERRRLGRGVRRAGARARRTTRRATRSGRSCSTILVDKLATTDDGRRPDDDDARADAAPGSPRERGSCARRLRPGLAAARADRPRRRPVVGARLPAPVRALARARRGPRAAARRPARLDGVRPAAARRRPAAARRPGGVPAPRAGGAAAVAAERERMADVVDRPDRDRRLRDARDVDAARPGPARRAGRRGRRCPSADPDLLAGPFAHIVVDEAQELTDARVADAAAALPVAQLHHRRRPRPGPARVHRVVAGAARAGRARPGRRWPR